MKLFHNLAFGNLHPKRQFCSTRKRVRGVSRCCAQSCRRCVSPSAPRFVLWQRRSGVSRLPGRATVSVAVLARGFLSRLKLLMAHRRLPNCAEVGVYLRGDVGGECRYPGGNWGIGATADSTVPTAPDSPSSFAAPGEYASNHVARAFLAALRRRCREAMSASPPRRDTPSAEPCRKSRLQFTVADEHGRLVQDLSPDDIRILDDQSAGHEAPGLRARRGPAVAARHRS